MMPVVSAAGQSGPPIFVFSSSRVPYEAVEQNTVQISWPVTHRLTRTRALQRGTVLATSTAATLCPGHTSLLRLLSTLDRENRRFYFCLTANAHTFPLQSSSCST